MKAATPEPARVQVDWVDLIEMHRDRHMHEWTTVASLQLG
jgi:hypothetical protein